MTPLNLNLLYAHILPLPCINFINSCISCWLEPWIFHFICQISFFTLHSRPALFFILIHYFSSFLACLSHFISLNFCSRFALFTFDNCISSTCNLSFLSWHLVHLFNCSFSFDSLSFILLYLHHYYSDKIYEWSCAPNAAAAHTGIFIYTADTAALPTNRSNLLHCDRKARGSDAN